MPKLKTRKDVAKRVRVSRNGKLIRRHAWKSHLLEHKSAKRKRGYASSPLIHPSDVRQVRQALGI
ncbi:MAG: 50S ribosomal protein L35 [Candidatus Dormibacteraeota bacterium]|nr:50S ribosomal protein L35 [Candidatus Dormibacteraeota bacterium]